MRIRIRWARALITAGSLMALLLIGIMAHVMLPSGAAELISTVIGTAWAIGLTVAFTVWCVREDGSRKMRLQIAAMVIGVTALIITTVGDSAG